MTLLKYMNKFRSQSTLSNAVVQLKQTYSSQSGGRAISIQETHGRPSAKTTKPATEHSPGSRLAIKYSTHRQSASEKKYDFNRAYEQKMRTLYENTFLVVSPLFKIHMDFPNSHNDLNIALGGSFVGYHSKCLQKTGAEADGNKTFLVPSRHQSKLPSRLPPTPKAFAGSFMDHKTIDLKEDLAVTKLNNSKVLRSCASPCAKTAMKQEGRSRDGQCSIPVHEKTSVEENLRKKISRTDSSPTSHLVRHREGSCDLPPDI